MHTRFLASLCALALTFALSACSTPAPLPAEPHTPAQAVHLAAATQQAQTQKQMLSGTGFDTAVDWDFFCTSGTQSGKWTTIKVPYNWELQGFGHYNYGLDKRRSNEQGLYRLKFSIPAKWEGLQVCLTFEGVMTDAEVHVNGQLAGPIHQGGFYRFSYDVSKLVKYSGDNLLEVTVSKMSQNKDVEGAERRADFWIFGGIFRPVYLEAKPAQNVAWTAIDARADGTFSLDAYTSGVTTADRVRAQIMDAEGKPFGPAFESKITDKAKTRVSTQAQGQLNWNAEQPHLYSVKVDLLAGDELLHTSNKKFGFRTIELRPGEGLFLNGQHILLKGTCRHSLWPESGRALNEKINYDDVRLMKAMNINAVRMTHYPPDQAFLDACDELGIYVLDEIAGWHHHYDTPTGKKLLAEMVMKDQKHPSILFWDNGNEGGFNFDLDTEYAKYDPQNRIVLHPWTLFNDIDTSHYLSYKEIQVKLRGPALFLPTEFLHGLYDGGNGASLGDYWDLMLHSPHAGGGFLWGLGDDAVVRTDKGGIIDADANHGPDGAVGPHREKEGSYYTIKEVWSPVEAMLAAGTPPAKTLQPYGETLEMLSSDWDGKVYVGNRYDFANLKDVSFEWQFIKFAPVQGGKAGHTVLSSGKLKGPDAAPGARVPLALPLPQDWARADALQLTATDWSGQEVWTWVWPIYDPASTTPLKIATDTNGVHSIAANVRTDANHLIAETARGNFTFDARTGMLLSVTGAKGEKKINFGQGPRVVYSLPPYPSAPREIDPVPPYPTNAKPVPGNEMAAMLEQVDLGETASPSSVAMNNEGGKLTITAKNSGGLDHFTWTVDPTGFLKLEYSYKLEGTYDYFGVSFNSPESEMKSMRWLGKGPFRVWQNRMQGTWLDVWQRDYNQGIAGVNWQLPEFAGYYAGVQWLDLKSAAGNVQIYPGTGLTLRVGKLRNGEKPISFDTQNPAGDVSLMNAISPIGNKTLSTEKLGPAGQLTQAHGTYNGEAVFRFDDE